MGAQGRVLHYDEWARNFTVIVYQEHVTEEDLDIELDELGVKCARSPLHNQDRYDKTSLRKWDKNHPNPTEEELKTRPVLDALKKPHWHVTVQLKGRKKQQNILKLFSDELHITTVWKENDPDHAIRYLCHLDSPKKAQYQISAVAGFGGIDLSPLEKLTKVDKVNVIATICDHVSETHCTNFYDLTNWVIEQGNVEMFDALVSKTAFFNNYMVGMQMKINNSKAYQAIPKILRGV